VDAAALILFVLVGVVNHDGRITVGSVARTAVPLLVAWFAVGWAAGAYRRPGPRTLLLTWLAATPLAVLMRSVLARGPWGMELLEFLGVALAFTLLFVLVARLIAAAVLWFVPETG
jgi:hypothetical protein